jgi:hypothetical protein
MPGGHTSKLRERGTVIPGSISILPRHRSVIIQLVNIENARRANHGEAPLSVSAYMHYIVDEMARQEGLA